jgi:predicted GH43/DUF377 family glycosyl hydrolase
MKSAYCILLAAVLLLTAAPFIPASMSADASVDAATGEAHAHPSLAESEAPRVSRGAGTSSGPPGPKPTSVNATMEITNMTRAVDEGAILRHLQNLVSFKTRYSYSPRIIDAAAYIRGAFEGCGLETELHEYSTGTYHMQNVIATLPGANSSLPPFYLGAHYDSTSNSPYVLAPGADDDGSGTAAVLSAAEVLSQYNFNRTLVFCAFSGEEQGLFGSKAYTLKLQQSGAAVEGALCLDMIAYNPAPGTADMRIRGNAASMDLAYFVHNVSEKYPNVGINGSAIFNNAVNSDHAAFWTWGWDAVLMIEKSMDALGNPNYHKTTDNIDYLNLTYAANGTQLAIACAAEKAGLLEGDASGPLLLNPTPRPNGYANETPTVSVLAVDPSAIDESTLHLYLNGSEVAASAIPSQGGVLLSYEPATPWPDGATLSCRATANDSLGNPSEIVWNFTVDGKSPSAPELTVIELVRERATKSGLSVDLGASGAADDYHVTSPSVIRDGALYKMWYGGCDDYPRPTGAGVYRIFYATSVDGKNWTKQGVVLQPGASGADSMHIPDCTVIKDGEEYLMWYSAHNGTTYRIMHARSADGLNWTKLGVAIDLGAQGSDEDAFVVNPEVVTVGSEFWLFYTAMGDVRYNICRATSSDGLNWTRAGTVFGAGMAGESDYINVMGPAVSFNGTGFVCMYTGYDGSRYRILKATSDNGVNWTRHGIAVDVGVAGSYDTLAATHPAIILENGTTRIWYSGNNGNYRILSAALTDDGSARNADSVALRWSQSSGEVLRYEVRASLTWDECLSDESGTWMPAQSGLFIHNGRGAGNSTTFYYSVRAVDRVAHASMHWQRATKVAVAVAPGWVPLTSVDTSQGRESAIFDTLEWDGLMAWNSSDVSDRWKTNFTVRPDAMNDMGRIRPTSGCWVRVASAGVHASVGLVEGSVSVHVEAGWNLIANPHIATADAAEAMAGIGAGTIIEGFDASATYRLRTLSGSDTMAPGMAYWIYALAPTDWVVNDY